MMEVAMKNKVAVGAFLGMFATQAFAFIAPSDAPAGIKVKSPVHRPDTYRSEVSTFSDNADIVQLDKQSNSIRSMAGKNLLGLKVSELSSKALEAAAIELVSKHKDIFGVEGSDVRVNPTATLVDSEDQSVSLHVYRNGLRIKDAGITLRFKKGTLVSLKSETYAEAVVTPAKISNTGDLAASALNSHGYISRGSMWRVQTSSAGYQLVKVDEYLVAGADAAWVVQVDTTNGQLFEVRSKNVNMRGRAVATAYPRYFGDRTQEMPLAYAHMSNSSAKANERGEFNSSGNDAPSMEGFKGQFVKIHAETGEDLVATAKRGGSSWNLKFDIETTNDAWDNNDMAQAMVYVHANKIIDTAKKYIKPSWFNEPITANVNHSDACNAYWDGSTINFFSSGEHKGKTCANTGLIADVVYHEWGHGLDENTGGIEDGALSEGFGDAVALLMTDDPRVGVDFMPLEHKPVRDMSEVRKFPEDVEDEVHADGLIVGGAWYDMYTSLKKKLGKDKANHLFGKFLFKGIYQATKMSDVYDATLALDDNDGNVSNGTPNFCEINKAFAKHGLAKEDSDCR
jgi:hypothetical protein